MWIIIFIIWILFGGLSHYKFYNVAKEEGLLNEIDTFGIFLMYILAPYWVLRAVWYNVVVRKWEN